MAGLPKVGLEATIVMGDFLNNASKINKTYEDLDTGADKVGKGSISLSGHLTDLGGTILKLGGLMAGITVGAVATLSAALTGFAVGGIKQAVDLDQQVANIAATMGATRETAGTLKDELKGLALDLSLNPNLTVDVTQAGQAIEVLAANGALATDEFGKLTQGSKDLAVQTVALANATGSDFGTAATIATDAANIFGLEVDEMGKAVDGAAGIMNASKFDANDYSLALANAGPVTAEMGVSLEDFNTVIAGTASSFASGSDAGTSFKTLMQRLANPTKEVAAEMEKYGISLFDADGNMRDMKDIVADLNQVFFGTVTVTEQVGGATKEQAKAAETASSKIQDLTRDIGLQEEKYQLALDVYNEHLKYYDASEPAMRKEAIALEGMANQITDNKEKLAGYQSAIDAVSGVQVQTITSTQQLTEAQRAQLAATLGGADGARILLGLAGMEADEFDTLSQSVNRSGQGLEAAALRVDTVKGAFDIFRGVIQAIQIQVGDKFLPLLKQMAVNFTRLATQAGPAIVDFFGQIATSIGNGITAISTGIEKISGAFQRFGVRGAAVSILGQLGLDPTQIAGVMAVVDQVTAAIDKITGAFQRFGLKGATVSILGMLGLDPTTIGTVFTTIDQVTTTITESFNKISGAYERFGAKGAAVSILGQLGMDPETIGLITTTFDTVVTTVTEKLGILQQVYAQFGAQGAGVSLLSMLGLSSETISLITTTIQTVIDTFTALSNWWLANWPLMAGAALTAWQVIQSVFAGIMTALTPVYNQLLTTFGQLGTPFQQLGATLNELGINWQSVFKALLQATGIVAAGIGAALLGIIGVITGVVSGVVSGVNSIIQTMMNLWNQVGVIFQGLGMIVSGWVQVFSGDLSGLSVVIQGAVTLWKGIFGSFLTIIKGTFDLILSTVGGFVNGIVGFFQGLYDTLVGHSLIPDLVNDIVSWFKKLPQMIVSGLSGLVSKITAPFEDVWKGIKKALKTDEWMTLGQDLMDGLLEGIKKNSAQVLEFLKNLAYDSLASLKGIWQSSSPSQAFAEEGRNAIQGILQGAMEDAPKVTDTFGSIGQSAIDALMTGMTVNDTGFKDRLIDDLNLGGLLRGGGSLTGAGLSGGHMRDIRSAIQQGIKGNMGLLEAGGDPSAIAKIVRERAVALGLPPGALNEYVNLDKQIQHLTGTFSTMYQKMRIENLATSTQLAGQFSSMGQGFADMLQAQIDAFDKSKQETAKLGEANTKLTETLTEQQSKLTILQAELAELTGAQDKDTIAIDKKKLAIAELSKEMDKNRAAIVQNEKAVVDHHKALMASAFMGPETEKGLARIELLQEFLKGNQKELVLTTKTQSAYGDLTLKQTFDRAAAQIELNKLLAEQAKREQDIAKAQEAQKKLDFLTQQINLVKLISDRGLNPANILGGMKLGLEAGVGDLLSVTNRVVEAMVAQINKDLQIHSPSRVMAGIGQQMMAGLQGGIASMAPVLQAQLSASVTGPISPLMAGALGAGGGDTYNYHFNTGGNNIYNQTDEAVFEQRVIRAIQKQMR